MLKVQILNEIRNQNRTPLMMRANGESCVYKNLQNHAYALAADSHTQTRPNRSQFAIHDRHYGCGLLFCCCLVLTLVVLIMVMTIAIAMVVLVVTDTVVPGLKFQLLREFCAASNAAFTSGNFFSFWFMLQLFCLCIRHGLFPYELFVVIGHALAS